MTATSTIQPRALRTIVRDGAAHHDLATVDIVTGERIYRDLSVLDPETGLAASSVDLSHLAGRLCQLHGIGTDRDTNRLVRLATEKKRADLAAKRKEDERKAKERWEERQAKKKARRHPKEAVAVKVPFGRRYAPSTMEAI